MDERGLWHNKVEHLQRFAALTTQMDGEHDLDALSRMLRERETVIAAVDRLDGELTDVEPPADLRAIMQEVLSVVTARDTALRQRLDRALRERAERLLAAAVGFSSSPREPAPRFLDRRA